jgi:hypothetical protein
MYAALTYIYAICCFQDLNPWPHDHQATTLPLMIVELSKTQSPQNLVLLVIDRSQMKCEITVMEKSCYSLLHPKINGLPQGCVIYFYGFLLIIVIYQNFRLFPFPEHYISKALETFLWWVRNILWNLLTCRLVSILERESSTRTCPALQWTDGRRVMVSCWIGGNNETTRLGVPFAIAEVCVKEYCKLATKSDDVSYTKQSHFSIIV